MAAKCFTGLWITTECGRLIVSPGEIVVLPQGFRFAVDLPHGPSRGYVAEVFGTHFQLPDLSPMEKRSHDAYKKLKKRGIPLASKQVNYSLIHRAPEKNGVTATCDKLGITLIAYSPIAQVPLKLHHHLPSRHVQSVKKIKLPLLCIPVLCLL